MKIQVATVVDFIEELSLDCSHVQGGIVRVQIYRTPEQDERISFDVAILATAIMLDDAQRPIAILEYIEECGRDSRSNDNIGSEKANSLKAKIGDACKSLNLNLRPGKFELF